MHGKKLYLPMILLLLSASLNGCGTAEANNEQALTLRSDFLAMTSCSGCMELTADYGQRVYDYTVTFMGTKEDGLTLTLTAPEEVSGITAHLDEGQTFLTFDGVRLETGPLNADGLSPLDALPIFLSEMRSGYIAETGPERLNERETLRICCRDPDQEAGQGLETVLWFDQENDTLLRGELRSDGTTVITCRFSEFIST